MPPLANLVTRTYIASVDPATSGARTNGWYGQRGWYAQLAQDRCLAALFAGSRQKGYYVDLAANDAIMLSNTYYLDRNLTWRGLCIEPNPAYLANHLSQRTCDVAQLVVSSSEKAATQGKVRFRFSGENGGVLASEAAESALKKKILQRYKNDTRNKRFVHMINSQFARVSVVDIATVLRAANAPRHIDYLSLDVEGSEYEVMSSFPWHAHEIDVLTIERPPPELHRLMMAHGYCVRAMFGNEVADVLYIRSEATRAGERIATRRFRPATTTPAGEPIIRRLGDPRAIPCYSPKPLSKSVNAYFERSDWCLEREKLSVESVPRRISPVATAHGAR